MHHGGAVLCVCPGMHFTIAIAAHVVAGDPPKCTAEIPALAEKMPSDSYKLVLGLQTNLQDSTV